MSNNANQQTNVQEGEENLTTQIQHKVEDIKEATVNTFSKKEPEPEPEPKAFGEHLDDAVEGTKSFIRSYTDPVKEAVTDTVHDNVVAPAGETMVKAGEMLKEKSEELSPTPPEKSLVEKVQDNIVEPTTEKVKEGINKITGKEEEKEEEAEKKKSTRGKGKGKKGKKGKAAGAVDDFEAGSDFSADDLFEDGDSGRPGKGKKAGKKLSKKQAAKAGLDYEEDEPAPAQADGAEDETLEAKIKKSRPPPKVRIDSGVQPGYVNVRLEDISVIFRNQEVCSGCTWGVQTGDRVGLVGANGGGKTTQLRIMYGELEPTAGEVVKSSADLRISFLRQEFVDDLVLSRTLKEELQSVFIEEAQVMEELDNFDKVLEGCKNDPDEMQRQLDRMQDLQRRADSMQVSMLQSKVEKIMDLMGFTPEEGDALVASFSGGWKMRIGLGKILLTEPNLLLLDEPTNHLDLESIEWMEKFLINQKIPMVIVSHDREFLDRVCNKIVDVEGGKTQSYDGNYSRFLKLKQERREAWESAYNAQMKKVKAEKDWINRFKSGAQAAQAASRQKKLDKKMASDEWVQKPPTPGKPLRFRFPPAPRVGDGYAIMTATGIGHGYEQEGRESVLFSDVQLNVEKGERVAFLGPNGCGKSTFLRLVVGKEKPNEGQITLGGNNIAVSYYEQNQADVLDLEKTVLETMKDAADGRMEYEEIRALLGQFLFKGDSVDKKLEHLSGGEKARVALCTMMMSPANLLVLDEPTNHLDLGSCVWLEDHLKTYDKILVITSHSQDFLNGVCTNMMVMRQTSLQYWAGNYDQYVKTRLEQETNQMKLYQKQQEEIKHTKDFIASCGTYANLVKQAKSRQKMLDRMEEAGLIQPVQQEKRLVLKFPECGKLVPPVIAFTDVAFSYSGKKKDYLYRNLNIGVDSDSRIALLGPNGAGKSTLVKLMRGDLHPTEGSISRRPGLRLGSFNQHSADQLDPDMSPISYIQSKFPDKFKDQQEWRTAVGRFGITGEKQVEPIWKLSEGLKSRLVFTELAMRGPHVLLLDEPTNHLDMECIDSLADAIKEFDGGMVLVSHDFRLIEQVATEIWVCDKDVIPWKGTIREYKDLLRKQMAEAAAK
mmetsp:Transcript_58811/g.144154  ORF Transcript_58811/g.144154 Transcript_58811/m.144154 type:complete len:1107 (+) Transcript_58811:64-3384(+)